MLTSEGWGAFLEIGHAWKCRHDLSPGKVDDTRQMWFEGPSQRTWLPFLRVAWGYIMVSPNSQVRSCSVAKKMGNSGIPIKSKIKYSN